MKQYVLKFSILLLSLALAGCNTIQGAGKDIQKAGEVVEESAKKAKKG